MLERPEAAAIQKSVTSAGQTINYLSQVKQVEKLFKAALYVNKYAVHYIYYVVKRLAAAGRFAIMVANSAISQRSILLIWF